MSVRLALPAKLTARRHAGAIARPRLFARLDAMDGAALTWVQGPAGAGKTTLVSTWVRGGAGNAPSPVLWYRTDETDIDLPTLLSFIAQAARAKVRRRRWELPALTPEYLPDLDAFLRRWFRLLWTALPERALLVLDGAEQVPEAVLLGLLTPAMAECRPGQRVVVTSRQAPPEALTARGLIDGSVALLGWDELRLDHDEAQTIAHQQVQPGEALRLNERCGGWAAGFVLGLDQLRLGSTGAPEPVWLEERLFPYFAKEMFDRTDPQAQAVLMYGALLAEFRIGQLAALLPHLPVESVVLDLYRRHHLIDRSHASPPVYRLHDLFREFLLQLGMRTLPADDRARFLRQAAQDLTSQGQWEAALPLLRNAEDWPGLSAAWCHLGPAMLMSGRHMSLAQGLGELPTHWLESDPWALYWLGMARLQFDQEGARPSLEAASRLFEAQGQREPCLLACGAMLQSHLFEMADMTPVDAWGDRLQRLLLESEDALTVDVEVDALFSAVALMPRGGRHMDLVDATFDRATKLLRVLPDGPLRFKLALFQLQVANFRGDWHVGMQLLESFAPFVRQALLPPAMVMIWNLVGSAIRLWGGDPVAATEMLQGATEDAERRHLKLFEPNMVGMATFVALQRDDLAATDRAIERARQVYPVARQLEQAQGDMLFGLAAHLRGDERSALQHLHGAIHKVLESGTWLFAGMARLLLAGVLVEQRRLDDARAAIDQVLDFAARTRHHMFRHSALLIEAWAGLRGEGPSAAIEPLSEALVLGRERGLRLVFPWCPSVMLQELGQLALREGIEPDLVREMLALRRIAPPGPDADPWPWPLRVRTLGRFEVERAGQALTWGAKTPRKPLELLQAVLALDGGSGRGAPVTALVDLLWPDSEGDAAQNAFNVALSRLRKLLGDAQALQQRDGRLVLDGERVWTDVAAVQRWAERVDSDDERLDAEAVAQQLLDVYRGPFLVDHASAWSTACRERQQTRFRRALSHLTERLRHEQRHDALRRVRERWLQVDAEAAAPVADEAAASAQRLKLVLG